MAARGRKPRTADDGELRRQVVALRLSPAEYARVIRAAGDAPLGTWAHRVVMAAAPSITEDPDAIRAALDVHLLTQPLPSEVPRAD